MTTRLIAMAFAIATGITMPLLATSSVTWAQSGQTRPYSEMPDDEFLQLFGSFEWCRNPLIHPEKYLKELEESYSANKAQSIFDDQERRCKSIGGNGAMIARFQGYEMEQKTVSDPAFWNYIDQVRARSGAQ